jgi:hypothetical protein
MNSHEPQPKPGVTPVPSHLAPAGGGEAASTAALSAAVRLPLWLVTLGAGIIAGTLSGLGGEATGRAIPISMQYPAGFARLSGYHKEAVMAMVTGDALRVAERKRAAAAYGLLGVLLGVGLGLAGGLARGSLRSGVWGAVVGSVAGAVAGAVLSAALVPVFFQFQDPETDATMQGGLLLLFTRAGIFSGIGAAGGLALGWGLGDRRLIGRAAIGGLLGAVFGALVFDVINSLVFPMVRTYEPMPAERTLRMLVQLCVAIGAAVLAGLAATVPLSKSISTPRRLS